MEACIASDVYNQYVLTELDSLSFIDNFKTIQNELVGKHEIEISLSLLEALNYQMTKSIENLAKQIKHYRNDILSPIVSIEFCGIKFELNYKDETHFTIALLISAYKLFQKTIHQSFYAAQRCYKNIGKAGTTKGLILLILHDGNWYPRIKLG